MIAGGTVRTIDAGRHTDVHGVPHWFAGVLGAGFDSVVNERANTWHWPRGRMRYHLAVARELPVFRPIPYVIEVDGVSHPTQAMLVAVANGPSYGGGMRVCPDASFEDGIISYADGERFAPLPMSCQIVPGALKVLVAGPLP